MKFTNKLGLPQPIYAALTVDNYSRGDADISVTQLIDSPRIATLSHTYEDVLEEDVINRVWAVYGTAVHILFDDASTTPKSNRRLYTECSGWRVSGEYDYLDDDGVIWDWKVTTTWEIIHGIKPERERQLNLYKLLATDNGLDITGLRLGFLLRDWTEGNAARDNNYPQFPIITRDVPSWSVELARTYLNERVKLHQQARVNLPDCTPEERWAEPTTWAVTKAGNTRATRVFNTENEALAWHQLQTGSYVITQRLGDQFRRCAKYCPVGRGDFCEQFNSRRV